MLVGAPSELLRVPGVNVGLPLACFAVMADGVLMRERKEGRRLFAGLVDAFVLGAKYAIGVGAAAATVGIIVGVVTLTGVGFKISWIVTSLSDQWAHLVVDHLPFSPFDVKGATLFFTLVLTGIVCILLGCGVPTTATYIIMVTVATPALGMLGVAPLVAHFFVFYYGVLADITPPVAIAAYAGASMAGADPFKAGNTAFRLAMGKVLVPFVFAFSPALLIVVPDFTLAKFAMAAGTCLGSVTLLSAAFAGWFLAPMAKWERVLVGIAGLPMIHGSAGGIAISLVLAMPVLVRQLAARRAAAA